MMRQMGKQKLTIARAVTTRGGAVLGKLRRLVLALGLGAVLSVSHASSIGLSTGIVTDPLTGVALFGFDPVSYFTEEEPLVGLSAFELEWGGASWLFANAANRDVFRKSPEIYAPQFGGYGLMVLSRGYLSDGKPRIFALLGSRLFLFYSTSNRDAFMASQRKAYTDAVTNWTRLSADFVKS